MCVVIKRRALIVYTPLNSGYKSHVCMFQRDNCCCGSVFG